MEFADRAARNEEIFRGVNERIERGAERHGIATQIRVHCECGQAACFETVDIARAEYECIAGERYHFVLVPGHEQPQIERVVERYADFVVAEKIGEAHEQIDRDHPQQRDRA
jgi:hypothetical protein